MINVNLNKDLIRNPVKSNSKKTLKLLKIQNRQI